ncbi:MAG: hypothetical protein ACTSRG_01085 [Candidatus Helarchaeota archaeon]
MEDKKKAESVLSEFESIERSFKKIQNNINNVKKIFESFFLKSAGKKQKPKLANIGIADLVDIPDELRKSVIAVMKLGRGTLDQVVKRTTRDKGLERGYLEALVAMGYLKKESQDGNVIYRLGMGRRKRATPDEVWKVLIKDSAEMVNFICNTEIEAAQLKMLDIDEMINMSPQAESDLKKIKAEVERYISALNAIVKKY